jgi:hypothetical protein
MTSSFENQQLSTSLQYATEQGRTPAQDRLFSVSMAHIQSQGRKEQWNRAVNAAYRTATLSTSLQFAQNDRVAFFLRSSAPSPSYYYTMTRHAYYHQNNSIGYSSVASRQAASNSLFHIAAQLRREQRTRATNVWLGLSPIRFNS